MNFLEGDLTGFDPRVDLDALIATVHQLVDSPGAGASLAADSLAADTGPLGRLLAALAAKHPMALAEVTCGGRAPGGGRLIRAVLPHVEALEKALTPRGCYLRLADLAGDAAPAVLATAATRHGAAGWLIQLSHRIEGAQAGATHLFAAAGHPGFATACRAHAEAGHIEGLVLAASGTGRPEPAAALLPGRLDAALRAASAALDANPASPIVPYLAAVWGPEPDDLLRRFVPLLRSRAAAQALRGACASLPRTAALLDVVIRGMV